MKKPLFVKKQGKQWLYKRFKVNIKKICIAVRIVCMNKKLKHFYNIVCFIKRRIYAFFYWFHILNHQLSRCKKRMHIVRVASYQSVGEG